MVNFFDLAMKSFSGVQQGSHRQFRGKPSRVHHTRTGKQNIQASCNGVMRGHVARCGDGIPLG